MAAQPHAGGADGRAGEGSGRLVADVLDDVDVLVWTTESPEEQAALLLAAATELGVERPIVLGHSYGGAVAIAWALNHPDRIAALVDISGVSMPWPGGLGALYRINGNPVGGAIVPPLIAAFAPETAIDRTLDAIFAPNPVPRGYAGTIGIGLSLRPDSFRANARQVNTLRPHVVAMSERYPTLDLPVEIVHGDADTIVPPEIHSQPFSQLVPGANLVMLPGVGHMPHHVDRDAVIAAIDRAAERAGLR